MITRNCNIQNAIAAFILSIEEKVKIIEVLLSKTNYTLKLFFSKKFLKIDYPRRKQRGITPILWLRHRNF